MKIDTAIIAAIFSLVGVFAGATVQFLLTKRSDTGKHYRDLQTQAYVELLRSIAGVGIARNWQRPDDEFLSTVALTDSRSRIAIYGSKTVATATAHFFERYGNFSSPEAIAAYIEVARIMRSEVPTLVQPISTSDIQTLVIGL